MNLKWLANELEIFELASKSGMRFYKAGFCVRVFWDFLDFSSRGKV